MQTAQEKMIGRIEIRLQFIVTILVFFLAIFPSSQLPGCILVAAYIIDYIAFAVLGERISEKSLKWLNNLILIGIGSYVIPLAIIALSTQKETMLVWQEYAWKSTTLVSLFLMVFVPVILLIMILTVGIDWKKIYTIK